MWADGWKFLCPPAAPPRARTSRDVAPPLEGHPRALPPSAARRADPTPRRARPEARTSRTARGSHRGHMPGLPAVCQRRHGARPLRQSTACLIETPRQAARPPPPPQRPLAPAPPHDLTSPSGVWRPGCGCRCSGRPQKPRLGHQRARHSLHRPTRTHEPLPRCTPGCAPPHGAASATTRSPPDRFRPACSSSTWPPFPLSAGIAIIINRMSRYLEHWCVVTKVARQ